MTIASSSRSAPAVPADQPVPANQHSRLTVVRRDGSSTAFDQAKISVAVTKAFLAVEGAEAGATHRVRDLVTDLTGRVVDALTSRGDARRSVQVEDIQDQVELALMRAGEHQVARAYVLYREERTKARTPADPAGVTEKPAITVRAADGSTAPLDVDRLRVIVAEAADGLDSVDPELILDETLGSCYDGIAQHEVELALVMAARALVETEPKYSFAASRLLLDQIRRETLGRVHSEPRQASQADMTEAYPAYFPEYIRTGIELGQLDPELADFDLDRLAAAIWPERDLDFTFLGLQTLYDRYFLHDRKARYELPQAFFMRVAMGLALREVDREARAIEFYELLSSFRLHVARHRRCSTPAPPGRSCRRASSPRSTTTWTASSTIRNNALLAKYSGGLGNDWTPVRGIGAHIKGTNGQSSGRRAVPEDRQRHRGRGQPGRQAQGRRLRLPGDLARRHRGVPRPAQEHRRRPPPHPRHEHRELGARRVPAPGRGRRRVDAVLPGRGARPARPVRHGVRRRATREYEAAADRGEIRVFRRVRAVELWRRMLTMLFETGHPWITFKDACNLRSPQQHVGVVHSSNLCTEITLNTEPDRTRSPSATWVRSTWPRTSDRGGLDVERLRDTVTHRGADARQRHRHQPLHDPGVRARSNLRHRPVGLGLMGFADALFTLGIPYASDAAVEFADTLDGADLATTRSRRPATWPWSAAATPSFDGSLWSRGILPIDSVQLLARRPGR